RESAGSGIGIDDLLDVRHGRLHLHDAAGRAIARLASSGPIQREANACDTARRNASLHAIAESDAPAETVEHVATIKRSGSVEVGHFGPAHPERTRLAHFE